MHGHVVSCLGEQLLMGFEQILNIQSNPSFQGIYSDMVKTNQIWSAAYASALTCWAELSWALHIVVLQAIPS